MTRPKSLLKPTPAAATPARAAGLVRGAGTYEAVGRDGKVIPINGRLVIKAANRKMACRDVGRLTQNGVGVPYRIRAVG